ncbi:cation:proton antiporter [Candidatus Woesearchaeota archaeon]|nr:cation:proton antiporter [Candidatus Woesearchaeota archaeon]
MAMENLLIRFLVLITILFFLPKFINKFYKVPYPLTEIFLGIMLGLLVPNFFYLDDMTNILATLGIITLFVSAGIEVDIPFITKNKSFFIGNLARHVLLFAIVGLGFSIAFKMPMHESLLVSIALTTPSASYILSALNHASRKDKIWVSNKAIAGEVIALILLIILLKIENPPELLLTIAILAVLIFALPYLFKVFFKRVFSELAGTEFSFIFVIALISAYLTEYLGVHFLIGAFIAGFISRRFVTQIVKDKDYRHLTQKKGDAIIESFGFFASTFIPFYFFSIGLKIELNLLTYYNVGMAIGLAIVVSAVKIITIAIHRKVSMKESFLDGMRMGAMLLPTLVFTFVIATLLRRMAMIDDSLFAILMFYGIFTSIMGLLLPKLIIHWMEKKSKH